jgi:hypothetical protein
LSGQAEDRGTFLQSPESSVALFVFFYRGEEVALPEVRPHFFNNDDFRVRYLPEKEIGNSHFARGADQEVGVGDVFGIQMSGKKFGIDLFY